MRWRTAVLCWPLMALAFVSVNSQTTSVQHEIPRNPATSPDTMIPETKRDPAPDFTLTDSNGKPLTLSKYRGKVVLLNFWATWCGGCKYEMPWFVEFDHKYRKNGLAAVGIAMDDEGMKIVKPFLMEKNIPYPSVIGDEELGKRFGLRAMPFSLLIDREGRIAVAHQGVVDKNNFELHIRQLLQT